MWAIAAAAYANYVPLMGQKPAPMLVDYEAHIADDVVFVIKGDNADSVNADIGGVVGFAADPTKYGVNIACFDFVDVHEFKDTEITDGVNHPNDRK